jgi:hypothetical protein
MKHPHLRSSRLVFAAVVAASAFAVSLEVTNARPTGPGDALQTSSGPASAGQTDTEDLFAWNEFDALTHATDKGSGRTAPEWKKWFTRCQSGLTSFCTEEERAQRFSSSSESELKAIDVPIQNLQSDEAELDTRQPGTDRDRAPNELSSVLFNPIASNSLINAQLGQKNILDLAVADLDRGQKTGEDRSLTPGTFSIGSTVIKLIWRIVPINKKDGIDVPVFVPGPRGTIASAPNNSAHPTSLLGVDSWENHYVVVGKAGECPAAGSKVWDTDSVNFQKIPISCFYNVPISASKSKDPILEKTGNILPPAPAKGQRAVALLLGFHVMKLTAGNPNWMWMTFLWTPQTNGRPEVSSPWSHYQMRSTAALREIEQQSGNANHVHCFNPYLEGTKTNGLHVNCLNCHGLAAYSTRKNTDTFQTGSVDLGERDEPYALTDRKNDEDSYLRGAVRTAFIWSISENQNNPLKKQVQAAQSTMLQNLKKELQLQ